LFGSWDEVLRTGGIVTDPCGVPQICLVIELAQPRKAEDGSISPAEIEGIRANLPARYFDIRVVTPEDATDEHGVYTGSTTDYAETNAPYELSAKYTFTVGDLGRERRQARKGCRPITHGQTELT
jgi:hypothetical protein